jgi:hypothetical protein
MDALKIEGRILKVMPAQSGTSQRTGNSWMSQEYVLQFHVWDGARNPNYFIFRVFGEDRIKQFAIKEGDDVRVHYYPDGHEHEGRWFGENDAHKVEILMRDGQPIVQPPTSPETPAPQQSPKPQGEGKDDDLPF